MTTTLRSPAFRITTAIRERHRAGDSIADLALDYDLTETVIAGIVEAGRNRQAAAVLLRHWEERYGR